MTITDDQIAALLHGGLAAEEAAQVQAAIVADPQARRRLAELQRLDALVRQAIPLQNDVPPELLTRLGLDAAAPAATGTVIDLATARAARNEAARVAAQAARPAISQRWLRSLQAAAVVGVAVIGLQWLPVTPSGPASADYHTLGDSASLTPPAAANAIVIFADSVDAGQARALVTAAGGRIVGRPTSTGAWRVMIAPDQRLTALAALRARPDVTMAEAIDGSGR